MLSEGKNIDQVFREKAEAFNPGRTLLEADWAGISGQLPVREKTRRPAVIWLRSAAAVAAILVLFFAIKSLVGGETKKQAAEQPVAKTVTTDTGKITAGVDSIKTVYPQLVVPGNLLKFTWTVPGTFYAQEYLNIQESENNRQSQALQQFFHQQVAVQPESFTINNNQDNTINCKKGTNIFIPANTFYSGGALINGDITFSVTEYYTLAEMAAAKLNTTSGGQILKSGGMLYLQAMYNNQAVDASLKNELTVNMPAQKGFDPQMQLFLPAAKDDYATRLNLSNWTSETSPYTSANTFEWAPAGQLQAQPSGNFSGWETSDSMVNAQDIFSIVPVTVPRGRKPDLPPVRMATIDVIQPYKIIEKTNTAVFLADHLSTKEEKNIINELENRYTGFNIRLRSSFVGNKQFITQTNNRLPQYISSLNDSTWIPFEYAYSKGLGKPQDRITYDNWLNSGTRQDTIYREMVSEFAEKQEERQQNFRKGIEVLQNKYRFSISQLGWINCDRFYDDSREKTNLYVQLEGNLANYSVLVVFPRINAVAGLASLMPGNRLQFAGFPLGEPIYIVAVGVRNGRIITGFKETTVRKEPVTGILFEETDAEAYKRKLQQLN